MKTKPRRGEGDEKDTYNLYGLGLSKPLSPFFLFILAGSKPVGGMKGSRGARLPGLPEGGGALPGSGSSFPRAPNSHARGRGSLRTASGATRRRPQLRLPPAALTSSALGNTPSSRRSKSPILHSSLVTSDLLRQRKCDGPESRKFWPGGGACATLSGSGLCHSVNIQWVRTAEVQESEHECLQGELRGAGRKGRNAYTLEE